MMILASASPRRRELLQQIGVQFRCEAADIDETPIAGEDPQQYVERMALEKARVLAQRYPDDSVLGSDTSVVLAGRILGKPVDDEDARAMLSSLSGREHQVMTAVALVGAEAERVLTVITRVRFCALTEQQINDYVATGEPADKAGAYGIQGLGAVLVAGIEGSYSNVVGLPLTETAALLAQAGISIWNKE